MANWLSAEDITARYAVKLSTLLIYSNRGNLGYQVTPRGKKLFNAHHVANLFPTRAQQSKQGQSHLGTLGYAVLGKPKAKTIVADEHVSISRIGKLNKKVTRTETLQRRGPTSIKKIA